MNKNRNPPSQKVKVIRQIESEILKDMLDVYAVQYRFGNKRWYIFRTENSKKWIRLSKYVFNYLLKKEKGNNNETI